MKVNPITLMIGVIFLYPIIKGFLFKFSSNDLKLDIDDVSRSISFIISLIIGIYFGKKIFIQHDQGIYEKIYNLIPQNLTQYFDNNNFIVYAVLLPILIFICYRIIKLFFNLVNRIIFYPVLDSIDRFLRPKGNMFKRIAGMVFELPKAVCYALLVVFVLNIMSILNVSPKLSTYLEGSKPYESICKEVVIPVTNSTIAKQLPNVINNSFKIVIRNANSNETKSVDQLDRVKNEANTVVYYNGVTLDEGVKSNGEINSLAKALASEGGNTNERAEMLYNWIGTNISYDHEKANKVLNNEFNVKSGAIPTFYSRKGICFDYSCLYVAMARANNMKVRLITGEGFNGISWVSHAWNQVYIPEEEKWINVDTTFYKGGNYFDSRRFQLDHKDAQIAGEW
ncbi:transglutaminase-like domain-containing protein [Clostridium autoethanogenum]|uniref:Transglutaminase domain-containing protein n=2 Tax=Clostridium autoethanogenum TaxID=84023 RepID=A0A3M0SE50_9CLOT|nr:transglutaminase-like domain-containing protein [Clostridium autoethanogenum]AGY75672.1 transglutaminase-like domain-containing protein [Clostridium autoethanogenum DSM 10061]ALU35836.1 Membrane-bound protein with a transglutaminase domain-containing protein [Clostridium autoethanogenum DSM 10061]OVY52105.1 Transglutaminase-like superfamily protein [Clostridium autoethanogenum]RMC96141.1 transglutaminase domain-containing protein [Clostridium autoethanogenum]